MAQAELNGTDPDDEGPGCTWCERGSGMILLLGAAGLAYIGLDLLTGGWLSRRFVSGVTRAADAIDPGPEGQADEHAAAEGSVSGESAST